MRPLAVLMFAAVAVGFVAPASADDEPTEPTEVQLMASAVRRCTDVGPSACMDVDQTQCLKTCAFRVQRMITDLAVAEQERCVHNYVATLGSTGTTCSMLAEPVVIVKPELLRRQLTVAMSVHDGVTADRIWSKVLAQELTRYEKSCSYNCGVFAPAKLRESN